MSIHLDHIVGYSIDIDTEWSILSDEVKDRFLYSNEQDESLKELGFVRYSELRTGDKDIITVLDDGLGGEYTKLVYITNCTLTTYSDETGICNGINELLKGVMVPQSVKSKIREVYKEITGKELENAYRIKAEYIENFG